MNLLLGLIPLLSFSVVTTVGLTASDLTDLDRLLKKLIRGEGYIANAVRLNFHDCVGGCDGCLNINNPDNAGLEDLVAALETLYQDNNLSSVLSRADFWAYTGYHALNQARRSTNDVCVQERCTPDDLECLEDCIIPDLGLEFKYGRRDCETAPYTDEDVRLPSATLEFEDLVDFFERRFGFTAEETVALMGAHTIGGAKEVNSGFRGPWVRTEGKEFNNGYYRIMVNPEANWKQRNVGSEDDPRIQWNANGLGFMLNADMCMYKDIKLDNNGNSSCAYDDCGDSPLASLVESYADSNAMWIPDFTSVFQKMVANGYSSLKNLDA